MKPTKALKAIVERRAAVTVPGVPNPLFALAAERVGFEALYMTGAGLANMNHGLPDMGLVSLAEVVDAVHAISDVVDLPLIVDGDTGFGNPLNVIRMVRLLEKAGAAAIQIEDQVFPKRCGHFDGKSVIPAAEMIQKIKAATDVRLDPDLLIIARTDARAVEGLNAALDRAHAYSQAGADLIFVEAPIDAAEMGRVAREVNLPTVANIVYGGVTPDLGQDELAAMGFSIVLFANTALQASMRAVIDAFTKLHDTGTLQGRGEMLMSFTERQAMVRKSDWDKHETRYTSLIGTET